MAVGFTWGGWVTASTADAMSTEAVLATRSAIRVARFMNAPDHEAQHKAFETTESWERRKSLENGGWDKMPAESSAMICVSSARADGIEVVVQK